MSTTAQDRAFRDSIISETVLEEAVQWIADNMDPEDVFPDGALRAWARGVGLEEVE